MLLVVSQNLLSLKPIWSPLGKSCCFWLQFSLFSFRKLLNYLFHYCLLNLLLCTCAFVPWLSLTSSHLCPASCTEGARRGKLDLEPRLSFVIDCKNDKTIVLHPGMCSASCDFRLMVIYFSHNFLCGWRWPSESWKRKKIPQWPFLNTIFIFVYSPYLYACFCNIFLVLILYPGSCPSEFPPKQFSRPPHGPPSRLSGCAQLRWGEQSFCSLCLRLPLDLSTWGLPKSVCLRGLYIYIDIYCTRS